MISLLWIKGHVNYAAIAGMTIVPAYAYGITRTVRWKWLTVAILAAGSLGIASLPPDLVIWLVPAPSVSPRLRDSAGTALIEAVFIGTTMLVSGGITLYQYLRHTEAPGPAADREGE